MDALLKLNCSNSIKMFSRSRLIEKVRPIVHNDDNLVLVKLISLQLTHCWQELFDQNCSSDFHS